MRTLFRLGYLAVTGLVELQTASDDSQSRPGEDEDFVPAPRMRFRFQMPAWICSSILDSLLSKSISGWTLSLGMYRVLDEDSPEMRLAEDAFRQDDVSMLRILFQKRQLSPRDLVRTPHRSFPASSYLENTLFAVGRSEPPRDSFAALIMKRLH